MVKKWPQKKSVLFNLLIFNSLNSQYTFLNDKKKVYCKSVLG